MNTIFERNLDLLAKYQPNSYKKITEYVEGKYQSTNKDIDKIVLARQDDLVINLILVCNAKQFLLCNHEDPISQSYLWIDKYIDPSNKADIVFGLGMGFHLEVLLSSFENKKVIVVEPNIELFLQILNIRNMELIIKNSEIFLEESTETILNRVYELLWDTEKGGVQCQPFEVYSYIFENSWEELRNKFIKKIENFTVDITTRRHFGELWTNNNVKNLGKIGKASNAGGLVNCFNGIPGIIVSAGPSLSKNIHLLKEVKDKCVIIAAGTAVNLLENNGITPHFMAGIDAGEAEASRHSKVKSTDIYFIYSNQVAPGSLEYYKGPKFLMNYPVDLYTADFLDFAEIKTDFFQSGPTVSNTCFDVLLKMGCNPIILIGQDLAYTDEKKYASGIYDKVLNQLTEREKEGFIIKKDIYGNNVYTKTSFLSMKNWFEGYFEAVKDKVEIINATEGGLNIEFARNDTLKNVIDKCNFQEQVITSRIAEIHNRHGFPKDIDDKLKDYRQHIDSEIRKLEEFSRKQLKLVNLIKRDVYHPSKDKRAFDKIVFRVSEITNQVVSSPIYYSMLQNIIEIEFYLIKAEVDRATKELTAYEEVKDIFINAIIKQNNILVEAINKIKGILEKSDCN